MAAAANQSTGCQVKFDFQTDNEILRGTHSKRPRCVHGRIPLESCVVLVPAEWRRLGRALPPSCAALSPEAVCSRGPALACALAVIRLLSSGPRGRRGTLLGEASLNPRNLRWPCAHPSQEHRTFLALLLTALGSSRLSQGPCTWTWHESQPAYHGGVERFSPRCAPSPADGWGKAAALSARCPVRAVR